jgi:hypothetical protein
LTHKPSVNEETKADGSSPTMSTPNKVSATKVDEVSYKSDYFKNIVSQMNEKLQNKEK